MWLSKIVILSAYCLDTLDGHPTKVSSALKRLRRQAFSNDEQDLYGTWDWFINQVAEENKNARPTESPKTTRKISYQFGEKVDGDAIPSDNRFAWFSNENKKQREDRRKKESTFNNQILQQRGAFFPGLGGMRLRDFNDNLEAAMSAGFNSQQAIENPFEVQFVSSSDNQALMWDTFAEGSGDEEVDRSTSFSAEKPENKNFIFHTETASEYDSASFDSFSRVIPEQTLLPVNVVNEWYSNEHALGGAIYEITNFIYGDVGTCFLKFPTAVYWMHVFNAHIDPVKSQPGNGIYALVAANQAFEGISSLDFIVNYLSDEPANRFDETQIQFSCDSTDTWTTSILSFPGNTVGDVGRTNVRAYDGFEGKILVIQFVYDVDNFYVDDHRLTVDVSSGNRFEITGISQSLLEEVWFGWEYRPNGWFTASDVLIGYFDES